MKIKIRVLFLLTLALFFINCGDEVISPTTDNPRLILMADSNGEPIVFSEDGSVYTKKELISFIKKAKTNNISIETEILPQDSIDLPESKTIPKKDLIQAAPPWFKGEYAHQDHVWSTFIACEKNVIRVWMSNPVYKYGWTKWGSQAIAGRCLYFYQQDHDNNFKRSEDSLAIEIMAHCLAARYGGFAYIAGRGWVYIRARTNVIDMGANEQFWD